MVVKRLKNEDVITEVNEIESSDDADYMGELVFSKLPLFSSSFTRDILMREPCSTQLCLCWSESFFTQPPKDPTP
jgi:hypothetical protein